jgi:hypothetical protein
MNSARKYAFAAALAVCGLNLWPIQAAAEDVHGSFTLKHEVHWQDAIVPAGIYRFNIGSRGPSELLTLTKIDSPGAGFMIFVNEAEDSKAGATSRIVLVIRPGGTFVSTMELPEYGMTLRFPVPAAPAEAAHVKATPLHSPPADLASR